MSQDFRNKLTDSQGMDGYIVGIASTILVIHQTLEIKTWDMGKFFISTVNS